MTDRGGGLLVSSPNNRAIFTALATDILSDYCGCGTNQPTRAIPRQLPS